MSQLPVHEVETLLRHHGWLHALARTLVTSAAAADDVVQETWLQAIRSAPRAADEGGRKAWLARVAANAARMMRRSEARRSARERAVARTEATPGAADAVQRVGAQRKLVDAVMALEPLDRDVVVLRYFENLAPRAIAQRLGLSGGAVRSRLSRALRTLRARLERHSEGHRSLRLLAAPLLPPVAGAATLGQMAALLTMKKVALPLLAVVLVAAAVWSIPPLGPRGRDGPGPEPPAGVAVAGAGGSAPPAPRVESGAAAPAAPRTAVRALAGSATGLGSELAFAVRFVDPGGRPIANGTLAARATVGPYFAGRYRPELLRQRPTPPDSVRAQASGDDGRASLVLAWPPERRPERLTLVARATGRCSRELDIEGDALGGPGPVFLGEVELVPGGWCEGRVLGADGAPAVGKVVQAVRLPDDSEAGRAAARFGGEAWPNLGVGVRPFARTDGAGRYRLDGLPVGFLTVLAHDDGALTAVSATVAVHAGEGARIDDLVLEQPGDDMLIRGAVSGPDGEPVAGASLLLHSLDRSGYLPGCSAESAMDGSFAVLAPPTDAFTLVVRDAAQRWGEIERRGVRAGERGIELQFAARRWIDVQVRDLGGAPVAGADAWLRRPDRIYLGHDREVVGPGRLRVLVPAERFLVTVLAPGFQPDALGPFEPKQSPALLEVQLAPAHGIRGRVLAAGVPVAGARLHLHPARNERLGRASGDFDARVEPESRLPVEARLLAPVASAADGSFFVPVTLAGSYFVHAEAEGFARAEVGPLPFAPGCDVGADLQLVPGGAIAGRVLTAAGGEAMGIAVGASCGDGHVLVARTDYDGAFRFDALAPGEWQVQRIEPESFAFAAPCDGAVAVHVRSGITASCDLDARHEATCRLRGRVLFDGRPPIGWHAWLDGDSAVLDPDGRFALRPRIQGEAWLWLRGPGFRALASWQLRVALRAGDNVAALERATGTVVMVGMPRGADTGIPDIAPYALVWHGDSDLRWQAALMSAEADGRLRVANVPIGHLSLRRRPELPNSFVADDSWPEVASFDLAAAEERTVTIR